MTAWSLRLRPDGVLLSDGASSTHLEARTAALFTYLAVEGATHRRTLAALLWPDSDPRQGRANLRKLLSRLGSWRHALVGPDPLALSPDLNPSAWELLPERLEIGEGTPLASWLDEARERRRRQRVDWLRGEISRLEALGHGRDALRATAELLTLEPSEATMREALALAGRSGLVREGLAMYEGYERRLAREVDAQPDPSTRALARDLARFGGDDALALLAREGARLHGAEGAAALQRIDAARPAWMDAWDRAVTERDAGGLERSSTALSDYLELRGESQLAVRMLGVAQLALDPSDVPGERRATGRLLVQLAWHEQRLGLPTAGAHAERGLSLLSPDEDAADRAQALYAAGRVLWARGDVAGARDRWDRAHAHLEGAPDDLRAAYLHGNVGMAADALGEVARAKRHYRSALERFRRHGAEGAATSYLNNLGQLLVEHGDVSEGARLLERGMALARAHGQRATLAYLLDSRSRAALAEGRPDRARAFLDEATELARSCSDRVLSASLLASEAMIALAEDERALPTALAALAAARDIGLRPAVLDALSCVADALAAVGAEHEADRVLATLAQEEGPTGASARARLAGRAVEPAGDVEALAAALVRS